MRRIISLLTLSFLVGLPALAAAQNQAPPPACKADMQKYCSKVLPGQGRIFACLQGNEDRIEPKCKEAVSRGRQAAITFIQACGMDVATLCGDVKAGQGRVGKCLQANEAKVSAGCKAYGFKLADDVKQFEKNCRADSRKFCKGVPPGMGRIYRCLDEKKAELSPACQKHFSGDK